MIKKTYKKAVFIFRRDLRLIDNIALNQAIRNAESVITVFNFDPAQVGTKNSYRSMNALQFMVESVQELAREVKKRGGTLNLFYGNSIKNIRTIIRQEKIDALFINADYTPFAVKRDTNIAKLCARYKIAFHSCHDALLIGDPDSIMTGAKTPYSIYTAFLKRSVSKQIPNPEQLAKGTITLKPIKGAVNSSIYKKIVPKLNQNIKIHGGRSYSVKILKSLDKFKNYTQERNIPALESTTHLSASHKFGTISIRESYHAIKKKLGTQSVLLKELYWRDFFTYVAYHSPFVFDGPYNKKYSHLTWSKNVQYFKKWCTGVTGFPIVDAGMRHLNSSGWMHNRVRMIVASFLIKDVHINWRWGERYFAQQLVDYDPAVNNGNWQWVASTGCDAQPYFRIFNPWIQQKKFDPDCIYIKKWIPELTNVPSKTIHNWFKEKSPLIKNYPRPIVDHATESKQTLKIYKYI